MREAKCVRNTWNYILLGSKFYSVPQEYAACFDKRMTHKNFCKKKITIPHIPLVAPSTLILKKINCRKHTIFKLKATYNDFHETGQEKISEKTKENHYALKIIIK